MQTNTKTRDTKRMHFYAPANEGGNEKYDRTISHRYLRRVRRAEAANDDTECGDAAEAHAMALVDAFDSEQ